MPRPAMQYPEVAHWQRGLSDDVFEPYSVLLEASAWEEPEPAGAALEPSAAGRPHVY